MPVEAVVECPHAIGLVFRLVDVVMVGQAVERELGADGRVPFLVAARLGERILPRPVAARICSLFQIGRPAREKARLRLCGSPVAHELLESRLEQVTCELCRLIVEQHLVVLREALTRHLDDRHLVDLEVIAGRREREEVPAFHAREAPWVVHRLGRHMGMVSEHHDADALRRRPQGTRAHDEHVFAPELGARAHLREC